MNTTTTVLRVEQRILVIRGLKVMIDADLAFHRALYQASANPLIEQSALLHWHHIRRAMGEALQHDGLRDPVWDEHTAIAQAVAQGDAEHAEALMREHSHQASLYLGAQAAPAASAPSPDNSVVR